MDSFLLYVIYGIFGGPAIALSYGLGRYDALFCFLTLSATYILSVLVIHIALSSFNYEERFKSKIFSRVNMLVMSRGEKLALKMDDVAATFRKEFGDAGFYLALTSFSIVFGVYWTALIAFIMRLDLWRTLLSISIGAVVSVGFWTLILVKNMIDPQTVTLFFMALTIVFIIYGLAKENRILLNMSEKIASGLGRLI